jgi:outer membrane protein assembly factor BamC
VKFAIQFTAVGVAVALSACSVLETDKVDYRGATKAPTLEVPPDLVQLSKDTRYSIVNGGVSANASKTSQAANVKPLTAAGPMAGMRIERLGNQRWLVVKKPADSLWQPLKAFWEENGFTLVMDQKSLGIMETEWAENRAKIPQDGLRSLLGNALGSIYSTSERDKFRTRIEVNADGDSEIYITHRGAAEVYTGRNEGSVSNNPAGNTVWQPRPADPELEAEFLRRLMVTLGSGAEDAQKQLAQNASKAVATVDVVGGLPIVNIAEGFDSAWRRVGLALDRTGFTVEDRDRKKGVYYVRYVALNPDKEEPGFFGKLFGGGAKSAQATKFQIALRSEGDKTFVSVLDSTGIPDQSDSAKRIVKVIADDIK